MQSTRTLRTVRRAVPVATEHLEPRTLLAAPYDFAAVGIRHDDTPSVFFSVGNLDENDAIDGHTRTATLAGVSDGPIDWTSLMRGERGSFTFGTRDGFEPYASQAGTQFIRDERWSMGSFAGFDENGAVRDHAVLGQVYQSEDFRISARGMWNMQMTRLTEGGGVETFELDVFFDFNLPQPYPFVFTYHLASGDVTATKTLVSYENGRALFDTGEVFVLLDDYNAAVLADFDATDGIVGVASGINASDGISGSSGPPSGWYRGEIGVTGPVSAALFGIENITPDGVGVADIVIQFNFNDFSGNNHTINEFFVYRATDWQNGVRTELSSGSFQFYFLDGFGAPQGRAILTFTGGEQLEVKLGQNRLVAPTALVTTTQTTEQMWGSLARQAARPELDGEFLVDTDANGRPFVYRMSWPLESGTHTVQYSFDLIDEAGGETVVGDMVIWQNLGNAYGPRVFVAGLAADGDVLVWQGSGDAWVFVNLTESTPGARPVVGELFSTVYTTSEYVPGQQFLSGFDDEGKLVVYHQAVTPGYPLYEWDFVDAERDGFDGAGAMPAGVESLTGWSTPWNAAHFIALDDAGALWSIWWAPGMSQWRIDNLTEASNGPVLFGRPTALCTSWNTFHISALDADGHVVMTWWALENDEWRAQDLTDDFDGPILSTNSLTSNFSQHRTNINIAGLDEDGAVRVYWWSPDGGWQLDTLSAHVEPEQIPLTPFRLTAARWGITWPNYDGIDSQSLLGENEEGDLVRLIWRSDRGPTWMFENITASAISYF